LNFGNDNYVDCGRVGIINMIKIGFVGLCCRFVDDKLVGSWLIEVKQTESLV
jgi:hypothetical protein